MIAKYLRFIGRRTIGWIALGVASAALLALVEFGIAAFIQLFLNSLGLLKDGPIANGAIVPLTFSPLELGCFLIGVGVTRAICMFFVSQSCYAAMETVNLRLRLMVTYDLLLAPKQRFISASEVANQIGETFPKAGLCMNYFVQLCSSAMLCIAFTIMMFVNAWREALVGMVGLGIIGVVVLQINRRTRAASTLVPKEQGQLSAGIERVARNWLLVKVLRTTQLEYSRFTQNIINYASHSLRAAAFANFASSLAPMLGIFLLVAIILLRAMFFHDSEPMKFLAFLYLFVRFVQNLTALASTYGTVNIYGPTFNAAAFYFLSFSRKQAGDATRIGHESIYLTGKIRHAGRSTSSADEHKISEPLSLHGMRPPDIAVRDLIVSYDLGGAPVLGGVSLEVTSGSQIAIVGPSGSGKSTLLGVILGVIRPTSGTVSVDGKDPEIYFGNANHSVGYVGAEPFLIEGTIQENLLYGARTAFNAEACWQALEMAALAPVVRGLNGQLSYRIAENGEGLSAGQKQRLSLARALLQRPNILVLDEVSANLDDETEREVAGKVAQFKGKATTIIVTHRPGMLVNADHIYELRMPGKILARVK